MDKPFKFKQFTVNQDKCAMKIGTDGVLLGAWAAVDEHLTSVLDIGAGTGILALQIAQRSNAELIDAIELDEAAYEQCVENFEASPWGDRLFCYHAGLDEFVDEIDDTYDLIISNPPFYSEAVESGDVSRDMARQNSSLPFDELIQGVATLLSPNGIFAVIIPFKEEADFVRMAESNAMYPIRVTRVRGNKDSEIKRSLMEFSFAKVETKQEELVIETARHQYTQDYIKLTRPFYLKM